MIFQEELGYFGWKMEGCDPCLTLTFPVLPVSPGEPRAPDRVLAMLRQSEPTSSTLQLVASDMTGIMEKLDTRELDLEDGEYDTTDANAPGACQRAVRPPSPHLAASLI